MNLELNNPSAFHALRVSSQARARNVVDKAPPAPAPKKRHTREELEKIGSEIVMVPFVGTVREGGVLKRVTREAPTPFHKTVGFDTLPEFITEQLEKQTISAQQGTPSVQRGERVVDSWGALQPRLSIPPGGRTTINLEEHTRLAISCDDAVTLQISNTSSARTIRLRNLDLASGEAAHCAWIPPAKEYPAAAIVSADKTHAAVVELQST
jgi:hypothetical protein